jgi:flagellar biosynthesis chaperone FliJ
MMDRQLATRLTQLKKGIQDLAEQELARRVQECEAAEQAYREAVERRRSAQASRNHCRTAAELQQWQGYVEALQRFEHLRLRQWQEAKRRVEAQRRTVQLAYQDVRRWETAEARAAQQFRWSEEQRALKEADESAVLRFGRSQI